MNEVKNCKTCIGCECEPTFSEVDNIFDCHAYVKKMNEAETAIEFLKDILGILLYRGEINNSNNKKSTIVNVSFDRFKELKLAISALKKQIPKKADLSHCECGMAIDDDWKHCPMCSQKIDWSETK